jgi:hypothetical protein
MPNWKSYDSSVRLLSAILAAHPELKLNYQGQFTFLFYRPTRAQTSHILSTLTICCPEIADCYGFGATVGSLNQRFFNIRKGAKAIKDARTKGVALESLDFEAILADKTCATFFISYNHRSSHFIMSNISWF